jgi:hypothetical protein
MKKRHLFAFLLGLITLDTYSQINPIEEKDKEFEETLIGEIRQAGAFRAKCVRYVSKEKDTTYTIFFSNVKYQTITDVKHFSFDETGGDFEKLYSIIKINMEAKEKKDVEIPLQVGKLILSFERMMGVSSMQLQWFSKGILSYSSYFTLNNYKKLFGKKDE